jgi:hypothetical protein
MSNLLDETVYGMAPLFPGLQSTPVVVEHTVKAPELQGKKKRGRPRNYSEVGEMMALCKSVTYTLRKKGEEVMSMRCTITRTAWEASRLANDLLKRRLADECTIKYEH